MKSLSSLSIVLLLFAYSFSYASNPQMIKIKDINGNLFAIGAMENNKRVGVWKFFISPQSKTTKLPDVTGLYVNGMKQGVWRYDNSQKSIHIKVNYVNDVQEGNCFYYDNHNNLIAKGSMENGMRSGIWTFYDTNSTSFEKDEYGHNLREIKATGAYIKGKKANKWNYDYLLNENIHVIGSMQYIDGSNSGEFEFFSINGDQEETLRGVGQVVDDIKTGKWFECNQDKQINSGTYNAFGERDGLWNILMNNKEHIWRIYREGQLHGIAIDYHSNGKVKYETNFENNLESGEFKSFFEDGQIQSAGKHYIENEKDMPDTIFSKVDLPYEFYFELVDQLYSVLDYSLINWKDDVEYTMDCEESKNAKDKLSRLSIKGQKIDNIIWETKKQVKEQKYFENKKATPSKEREQPISLR